MWCYKKPGFEALLMAELQRQQQHRQFCDTLLRAEGVSVPAHSCVLAAISPQMSTALSSSPAPPAGREHLVEFGTLGARSLLHVVRLLYSGEMVGVGENEKQEAVLAATKLGILGLVEVTRSEWQGGVGTDVGVQTDPVELSEMQATCWRREVSDGCAILWNETLSSDRKDVLTETEEMQPSSAPSFQSVPVYETIDMAQFELLQQASSYIVQPNVSSPLICSVGEAQNLQISSVAENPSTLWIADSQSCLFSSPQAQLVESERAEDEQFEQFRDDIPGFINHFLNMDSGDESHKERAKKKPRGTGSARQHGGAERPARRPQARRGRKGKGGWMQTVGVQEVGVSKQHKSLLQRCGLATSVRTGQGGGTTGKKLHLMTRHILELPWSPQKRRRWPKLWDFCQSGQSDSSMRGSETVKHGRRKGKLQDTQVSHTAPHSAPLPHVHPPEHFDHLFEETMKDMAVKMSSSTPHSQQPSSAHVCRCTITSCSGDAGHPAGSCIHSTVGRANDEPAHEEQQGEVDLMAILEDYLESLEQRSVSRETQEEQDSSRFPRPQPTQEETAPSLSKAQRASSHNAAQKVKPARRRGRETRSPVQAKKWIHDSVNDIITKIDEGRGNKALRFLPVVELDRQSALHQAVKNPVQSKTSSSTMHQPIVRKFYPIRSRYKATKITLPCESGDDTLEEVQKTCERNATKEKSARRALKRQAQPEEEAIDGEAKRKRLEQNVSFYVESSDEPHTEDRACKEKTVMAEHNKELDHKNTEVSPGSGSEEEDIDVIGALGSIPDPVTITWSTESEEEEAYEEIDVIGGVDSPVAFAVSNAVDR